MRKVIRCSWEGVSGRGGEVERGGCVVVDEVVRKVSSSVKGRSGMLFESVSVGCRPE